ncbi:ATP-binding cassette domain-containing protein [Streptomyces radiopugnans]|uniref:ABC-2 type transport system ATP-binding protein n=1 Tax=Streptomyces radiopugnans TaxID=403935 RepID=A0A1H9K879_9ACTN|nr:ATP-binding cassette domain-containing protein [Streptomyces radiopugnans]SEQ95272.1 ABC-2 type transport system ATP-binding protein [Streptomyces radiopugnans]
MPGAGIEVEGLRKRYGEKTALEDVTFSVAPGTLLGLLGHNGAGKTTTIDCLTTLLRPDGGHARVAGHDVVAEPEEVRRSIALTGQFAALDEMLTGRENLVLFGRLLRLGARNAARRADELLERFRLSDAGGRPVKEYSGGMRRRLDLAAGLVVDRPVLFLDEPTTGLDPRSREEVWSVVEELRRGGTTTLLTTQYLEEADRLADRVVVLGSGRVTAEGTPGELKDRVGGRVCEVKVAPERHDEAAAALRRALGEVSGRNGTLVVPAPRTSVVAQVLGLLEHEGVDPENVTLRKPSLNEVFFALTDPEAAPGPPEESRT